MLKPCKTYRFVIHCVHPIFWKIQAKNSSSLSQLNALELSELINSAGGYEDIAYPFGGFLKNKNSFEIDKISKETKEKAPKVTFLN